MSFTFDCLTKSIIPDRFDLLNYRRFDWILRNRLAENIGKLLDGEGIYIRPESDNDEVPISYGPHFSVHRAVVDTYLLEYVYSPKKWVDILDDLVIEYRMRAHKFQILVTESIPFICPECNSKEVVFPSGIQSDGFFYRTKCTNKMCTVAREAFLSFPSDELRETMLDMDALRNIIANSSLRAIIKEARKSYSQLRFVEEEGFDNSLFEEFVSQWQVVLRKAIENYDPERSGTFGIEIISASGRENGIELTLDKWIKKGFVPVSVFWWDVFNVPVQDGKKIFIHSDKLGTLSIEDVILSPEEYISFPSGRVKFITYLTVQLRYGMQKFWLSITGVKYPVYKDVLSRKIYYGIALRNRLIEDGIMPNEPMTMRWMAFFIYVSMKDFYLEPQESGENFLVFIKDKPTISDEEKFWRYNPSILKFDKETEKALASLEKSTKKAIMEYESYFQLWFDTPIGSKKGGWWADASGESSTISEYVWDMSSIDDVRRKMDDMFAIKSLIRKHESYWKTLTDTEKLAVMEYVETMDGNLVYDKYQTGYERERKSDIAINATRLSEKIKKRFPKRITSLWVFNEETNKHEKVHGEDGRIEYILETFSELEKKKTNEQRTKTSIIN